MNQIYLTDNYEYVFNFVRELRKKGLKTDVVYLDKLKQLIKYADRQKTPYVIIIGDDEIQKEIAILKNMKTGKQIEVTINNVVDVYEQDLNNKM